MVYINTEYAATMVYAGACIKFFSELLHNYRCVYIIVGMAKEKVKFPSLPRPLLSCDTHQHRPAGGSNGVTRRGRGEVEGQLPEGEEVEERGKASIVDKLSDVVVCRVVTEYGVNKVYHIEYTIFSTDEQSTK